MTGDRDGVIGIYRAVLQRPDGSGGWVADPVTKMCSGTSPQEAAYYALLLYTDYKSMFRSVIADLVGCRLVLVCADYGAATDEIPLSIAELYLTQARVEAQKVVAARTQLAEAQDAFAKAREALSMAKFRTSPRRLAEYAQRAVLAGASQEEANAAVRIPRAAAQRKKKAPPQSSS